MSAKAVYESMLWATSPTRDGFLVFYVTAVVWFACIEFSMQGIDDMNLCRAALAYDLSCRCLQKPLDTLQRGLIGWR